MVNNSLVQYSGEMLSVGNTPEVSAYRPWGTAAELMRYRGAEVLLAGPVWDGEVEGGAREVEFYCVQPSD